MALSTSDVLLLLLGFFFPPLAALIKRGCRADFVINCALTILGHVPGIIHAWYLVIKYPSLPEYAALPTHHDGRSCASGDHVVVVSSPPPAQPPAPASGSRQPLTSHDDPPPSYSSIGE
ncbi:hypothetical protein H4R35_000699 [Dimargaris xerosporica]|nr:hypothetical protein H4R35_000699 [Dimargaris xerosporica]